MLPICTSGAMVGCKQRIRSMLRVDKEDCAMPGRLTVVAAALALSGLAAQPAHADEAAARAFYQGKQVRIFTMGSPGGGYDTYTRAVSTFLEKKLGAKIVPT